jgi:hypothetical protein
VLSETFTLSLLTAVLLKGALEIVVAVKNRVEQGAAMVILARCWLGR